MSKDISQRLSDAYMIGDRELIESLKKEAQEYASHIQKQPDRHKPITVNNILNDENTSPLKVYEFLNKIFGEDWWELEFETIERLLWINYGTVLKDIMRDKIWGIKYLCNSQRPFLDWWLFNQLAVSLSGYIADFEFIRSPSPGMIITTVNTMRQIRPEEEFSREVKKYISILLIAEGIYIPPPGLMNIIKDEFEVMISKESRDRWPDIIKKYKQILDDKKYEIKENIEDIQARRIFKADEASVKYGN